MEALVMNSSFWQGKKVLLTGHTGFKGAWLTIWLQQLGARVIGVAVYNSASGMAGKFLT
jgi:CDP-glucose 4,6-dehydratase